MHRYFLSLKPLFWSSLGSSYLLTPKPMGTQPLLVLPGKRGLPYLYPGAEPCKIQFPASPRNCYISIEIFSKFSHHWLPAYAFPSECQARETGSLPSLSSCQIHGVSDSVSSDNRKLDSVIQEVPSSSTFQMKSAKKFSNKNQFQTSLVFP